MAVDRFTRRRALVILAAAAASPRSALAATMQPFEWRGIALGADARLVLWAADVTDARTAIDMCVAEIERLEQIFSLYRPTSEISRLNDTGTLAAASHDMVRLLQLSRRMNAVTRGLFDPTIQRLWEAHAEWHARHPDGGPLPKTTLSSARGRVGIEKLEVEKSQVTLAGEARLTLNGIAQGYITDRVASLLLAQGWKHVLIDLGEVSALGTKPDGMPWDIRIRETGQSLPLADAALATSAGGALTFDQSGENHHIFDPRSGHTPGHWHAVTVKHRSAAVADALSTALFVTTETEMRRIAGSQGDARIWATRRDGSTRQYN